jgi:hypothetical protein
MVTLTRRLPALLLMLALSADHAALCASWMETREPRPDTGSCPMHQADSPDQSSSGTVGKSGADICCAASEPDDRAPSPPTFALSASLEAVQGPVPLLLLGLATRHDAWRLRLPTADTHVPRHLLLSVLLV